MTKPDEIRIIPCGACGGDGGHHDFADHWARCALCDGDGEIEIELEPVTLEDLDALSPKRPRCPDLSTVEKRNAFYSSEEYRNMTTAEKCAVQGDGFINDYD